MSGLLTLGKRYRNQSDPLRSERRVELAAVAVTLLLLLQLLYSALRLSILAEPEPIAPSEDILAEPAVMSVASVDTSVREEITARPLFWASRRWLTDEPPGVEGANAQASGQETGLDAVKLVGIFGAGESAGIIALVKNKKRRILLGEELEGWTLKSIRGSDSVFTRAGRRETLTLKRSAVLAQAASKDAARADSKSAKRDKNKRRQAERKKSPADAAARSGSEKVQPTLSLGPKGRYQ